MITSWDELVSYFESHTLSQYRRDGWDAFLQHVRFRYEIPSIHITGTNGKGSTALKLSQIYALAGRRVGLFTSPALESYTEMIQMNGAPIREEDYLALFNEFVQLFEQFQLTTFEMQTFIAFTYFLRHACSFSVIEVGMGGLTDATNVFTPVLSILTNVTLEHQAYLGSTIEAIAYQKGGIIKNHIPVIVGPSMNDKAFSVLKQLAQTHQTTIMQALPLDYELRNKNVVISWQNKSYYLNTQAEYQADNAATILSAVALLQAKYPVEDVHLQAAFQMDWMPGRFECMSIGQQTVILDGAHNPGAIHRLIPSLHSRPHAVLFACFQDKDVESMMQAMHEAKWPVTLTTFHHPRSRKKYPNLFGYPFQENPFLALEQLLQSLPMDGVLLITGSLAFIGLMRGYMKGRIHS